MMLDRMVATLGRGAGFLVLALGMCGVIPAAKAVGFCDPGTIIVVGVRCHQVRPASTLLDAAKPNDPSSSVIAYSYGEFKADDSVNQVIFNIDLTTLGLGGPDKKSAQLRLFELGLGVTPKRSLSSGGTPLIPDGRAVTVTVVGADDATSRTLQVNLMNAPNGESPSLNYSANAAALSSVSFPVPLGTKQVYVYLDAGDAKQPWKTINGFVQTDRGQSSQGPGHPFTFTVPSGVNTSIHALYAISGVVAGDVMSGFTGEMVKTTIDYYAPGSSDFRN